MSFANYLTEADTDNRFGGVVGAGRPAYAPYGGGDPYYSGGAAGGLIPDADGLYASFHDAVKRHGKSGGGGGEGEGEGGGEDAIWWGAAAAPQMEVYGGEFDARTTAVSWFSYVGEGDAEYEGGAEYEEYEAYSEPESDEPEFDEPESAESGPRPAAGVTFVTAEPEGGEDGGLPGLTFAPCGCPGAE